MLGYRSHLGTIASQVIGLTPSGAEDRGLFARGAVELIRRLAAKEAGLYDVRDLYDVPSKGLST